jgi:hypothetical protein
MSDEFQSFTLYAVVVNDSEPQVPALFTSESDAERFCEELASDPWYGDRFTVVEVMAMHNYYSELDKENDNE